MLRAVVESSCVDAEISGRETDLPVLGTMVVGFCPLDIHMSLAWVSGITVSGYLLLCVDMQDYWIWNRLMPVVLHQLQSLSEFSGAMIQLYKHGNPWHQWDWCYNPGPAFTLHGHYIVLQVDKISPPGITFGTRPSAVGSVCIPVMSFSFQHPQYQQEALLSLWLLIVTQSQRHPTTILHIGSKPQHVPSDLAVANVMAAGVCQSQSPQAVCGASCWKLSRYICHFMPRRSCQ